MTLAGIANENEFYTEHYVHAILEGDLRELLSRWAALADPPYEALKKLRVPYEQMTREMSRVDGSAARLECRREWFTRFFAALGYTLAPRIRELEGGVYIPLAGEISRHSGEPELWILETLEPSGEPADPLTLPFVPEQAVDAPDSSRLPAADLETVLTKYVFAAAEPPRWVLLFNTGQVLLLDRNKWAQKRMLRFDLAAILNSPAESERKAAAALLHHDSVTPTEGACLLDTLAESSHKHAFSVSKDLKYSAREAVELLGNEVVWYRHQVVFDEDGNECWRNALNLVPGELGLTESFYRTEWEDVIQAQNITSMEQYVKAARLGRGTRLSREVKKRIWPVFQEYRAQMNEQGKKEYIDLIRDARSLLETRKITLPYRSVVIDEAQDMSAEAFRLLRAIVPVGENDVFLVGDAHQRIYHHRVTLGQCGINIKGRGKKLKVNYRTTEETRRFAVALLEGREIDDLDGGQDQQKGYMSLTHGEAPLVRCFRTFAEEAAFVKMRIQELGAQGVSPESICVVGRTRKILEAYTVYLRGEGTEIYEIRRDAAEQRDKPGIRIATMHRVKGLEFEHMFIVSANRGVIPLDQAIRAGEDAVAKRNAETGERALLYVALTRSKKSATVTGYGEMSPFLVGQARRPRSFREVS
jgi:UvrD-like helicase C-terminal domain/UvrD/REP helicase N-terminal domain